MEPAQDGGYDNVPIVTCRFSKFLFAIPCFQTVTSKELARLWYQHVFSFAGVPLTIVSDRGPQFIAEAWTSFMAALGVDTRFSTPGPRSV